MQNKVHNTIGGGVGVLGGILLYINSHLGTAFYALILLVLLNVVAAMWTHDLRRSFTKWMNVIMGVAIPFVIPLIAHTQDIGWTTDSTKTLVGLVFAALLSSTIPDILSVVTKVMTMAHIPQQNQTVLLADAQAEIQRLQALVQQQQATQNAAKVPSTADVAHNTVLNPTDNTEVHGA